MTSLSLTATGNTYDWSLGAGVYGLAKSYREDAAAPAGLMSIPYFFRGTSQSLSPARGTINPRLHENMDTSTLLSEEIELVLLAARTKKDTWGLEGFSIGNDLTNLGVFRQDPSLIMRAKAPTASLAQHWWGIEELTNDIKVDIHRIPLKGANSEYSATLGLQHLPFSTAELLSDIEGWNGIDLFDRILLYTGAPRGFAWSGEPIDTGDTIEVVLQGAGVVLRNLVEP